MKALLMFSLSMGFFHLAIVHMVWLVAQVIDYVFLSANIQRASFSFYFVDCLHFCCVMLSSD
jgi:hypothetical protein